jgi:hypothetical protein
MSMSLVIASVLIIVVSSHILINVSFDGYLLWAIYFTYSISWIILLHSATFLWIKFRKDACRPVKSRFTKFVEYAYAAVVAVGLLQVVSFGPRLADYAEWTHGNEDKIVNDIKQVSQSHIDVGCRVKKTTMVKRLFGLAYPLEYNFTEAYCDKLRKLVEAPDTKGHILALLSNDLTFFYHIIEKFDNSEAPPRVWRSPIYDLSKKLIIVKGHAAARSPNEIGQGNILAWLSLLLLPIGLGLRLLKTSIELFGNLEK